MNKSSVRLLLLPISLLYGLVVGLRNKMFDYGLLKESQFDVCTLVVGNLAVGGTGKTPHVIALARSFSKDFRVAILTRGYKRKSKGFRWVNTDDNVRLTGDEALEMKLKLHDTPIATDGNRRRGIQTMLKELSPAPQIIILDDGFQHRYLKPTYGLILTKLSKLYTDDYLLPAGNLRESARNAKRANFICVSGVDGEETTESLRKRVKATDNQTVFSSRMVYRMPDENMISSETSILLLTSIADPNPLLNFLKKTTDKITHLSFKDHHRYSERDILKIIRTFNSLKEHQKIILTTGKDLVKLQAFQTFLELPHGCVEVVVEFNHCGQDQLINEITDYVRKN